MTLAACALGDELDVEVLKYAERVCKQNPFALRMQKQACNQFQDQIGKTAFELMKYEVFESMKRLN